MDWNRALERNELALLRIVSALFALLVSARLSGSGLMVPRHVWRSILFVLRPAEAALRRLVIIAARGLVQTPFMLRNRSANGTPMVREALGNMSPTGAEFAVDAFQITPAFRLFDPLKHFGFDPGDETQADGGACSGTVDLDDAPVNALHLHNRLRALRHALADLPAQALRLVRLNARRDALLQAGQPTRTSLMRPGLPPGWRTRGKHEVDSVLKECHRLVRMFEDLS